MDTTDFKLITLEDAARMRQYDEDMAISDMEFTQLYAWQDRFQNRYKIINGYFCTIFTRDDGVPACYAPIGVYEKESYNETLLILKREMDRLGAPFHFDFVPENWIPRFGSLPGFHVSLSCDDDFSDYIYKAEDFLCLTGRVNEHKRYLVNYFKKHYTYEYRSLTAENRQDAMKVMENWCEGRDCSRCYWGCEKKAITRVLEGWDMLSCRGAVIYVDGEPNAFMVGEQIRQDMVVSHFQKADKRIKGLYAFISHEFYIREYPGITYINLQEDMGIPALRESKQSYRPCHMLRKYIVTLNERQG